MRKLLAAAALALSAHAHAATPFSTDVTDLWWNPDESGWGVNVIQQNNIVFATFFVYGADGRAHWFVASDMTAQQASASGVSFSGTLFETNGPFFAVMFNPAAVARHEVGTATLQFALPSAGILTYTVNGTSVTKQIRRQTWAANDVSGAYDGSRGILSGSGTGCSVGFSSFTGIQVAQSQTSFNMTGNLAGASCTFSGNYSQDGHLAGSTGTYACSNGLQGSYTLSEMEVSPFGFVARYSGTERGCTIDGRIGGVRRSIVGGIQ